MSTPQQIFDYMWQDLVVADTYCRKYRRKFAQLLIRMAKDENLKLPPLS